jgi:hypothetical protein
MRVENNSGTQAEEWAQGFFGVGLLSLFFTLYGLESYSGLNTWQVLAAFRLRRPSGCSDRR